MARVELVMMLYRKCTGCIGDERMQVDGRDVMTMGILSSNSTGMGRIRSVDEGVLLSAFRNPTDIDGVEV